MAYAYTKSKNGARGTSASLSCTTVTGVLRHRDRALRATKRQLSVCADLLKKRSLFSVEVERLFSSSELESLNAATTRRGSTTQPTLEVHAHHAADILTRILGLLVEKGAAAGAGESSSSLSSSSSSAPAAGLVLRRCIAAARACVETIVAALAEDESAGTEGETSLVFGSSSSSSSTSRLSLLGRLLVLDRQATSLLVHNESYGEGDDHALAHEENAEFIDGVIARLLVICCKTSTAGSLARHLFGKQYRLRQERSATGSGSSSCTPSTAPTAAFFVPRFVDEAWQFVFAGGKAVGKTSFEKLRRCLTDRLRLGQGRAVEDTAAGVETEQDPLAALESALWFPSVHDAASLAGLLRAAAETMMKNVRQDEQASVARALERHGYAIDVLLELWLFAVASNGSNFLAADTSRGSLRRELIEGSMVSEEGGLGELLECARWEGYSVSTEAAAIGLFGVCPTKHPILLKHVVECTSLQPSFREFVATIDGAPLAAPGSAPLAGSSSAPSANGSTSRAPERELPRNTEDAELDLS